MKCAEKNCTRNVWDEIERRSRHCIDHHPAGLSAAPLRAQLQAAKDELADKEAELRATRAVVVTERMEKRTADFTLLEEIAKALMTAHQVEQALTGAAVAGTDGRPTVRRRNDYPQPGSSTAGARRAARNLRRDLDRAVRSFEAAKDREWRRPPEDDPPQKLRCSVRGCDAYGIEQPAYTVNKRTGQRYGGRCSDCGTPLPGAETQEVAAISDASQRQ